MNRVVFDCMIYLQAAANATGSAGKCVDLAEDGKLDLYLSIAITAEVRDVLTQPKTRKKFSALTPEVVNRFLRRVSRFAHLVTTVPSVVSLPRDPADAKYLDLAIAANAMLL